MTVTKQAGAASSTAAAASGSVASASSNSGSNKPSAAKMDELRAALKAAKKAFKEKPEAASLKAAFQAAKKAYGTALAADAASESLGDAPVGEVAGDGCTVFVGNLDWGVRDDDGSALRSAFEGRTIQSIKWGEDRRSGKFAGCASPTPPLPSVCAGTIFTPCE